MSYAMQLQELAAVASLGADLVRSVNGDSSENGVIALPIHAVSWAKRRGNRQRCSPKAHTEFALRFRIDLAKRSVGR